MKILELTKPAGLALLSLTLQSTLKAEQQTPNVIIILADDIGYGDLGCYGATKVQTPNLDKFAAEGRRFLNNQTASAVSTPSRFAMLTGDYAYKYNIAGPVAHNTPLLIPQDKLTLPDVMKSAGYTTAAFGKWHLGIGEGKTDWNAELKPGPLELGFDYYFGVPVVNSYFPYVYVENHNVVGYDPKDPFVAGVKPETKAYPEKPNGPILGGAKAAHELYVDEMIGTTLTEKSVEWIKSHKEQPFFLYLATTNIHHPFTPHPRFQGTSEAGIYGDFIHELDWIVGEIMNTLKQEGLDDNTMVIFTSDNGAMLNQGGQGAMDRGHKINGDLFGFKFDAWEGGHNVPFIVRYPGKVQAGSESKQLISNVDMVATMASMLDYTLEEEDAVDSFDISPAIFGSTKQKVRDFTLTAAFNLTHMAYRQGDWVYIDAQGGGGFGATEYGMHAFGGPAAASYYNKENSDMADGKFKDDAPASQLYNLKKDPYQTTNLVNSNPKKAEQMRQAYLKVRDAKSSRLME